jgi:hypothetical protein
VARASKLIKKGVYVGIVLDTASTAIEIRTACSTGREEECTKAKYVEGGKLVCIVGVAAAAGTAAASTATATAVCVAVLGSATGPGALACMVVAAAVVGWGAGEIGGYGGELIGTGLYEVSQ